jgi:hypothetical protein
VLRGDGGKVPGCVFLCRPAIVTGDARSKTWASQRILLLMSGEQIADEAWNSFCKESL